MDYYTNFDIVSVVYQDFFIKFGKDKRGKFLQELTKPLLQAYVPINLKWLLLFPEDAFQRKRKAVYPDCPSTMLHQK